MPGYLLLTSWALACFALPLWPGVEAELIKALILGLGIGVVAAIVAVRNPGGNGEGTLVLVGTGWIVLCSLLSSIPVRSFWGLPPAMDGAVGWLTVAGSGILAASTLRTNRGRAALLHTVALVGFVLSVYAVLQWFGMDPVPWQIGSAERNLALEGRSFATMGNPIFLGALLAVSAIATLSLMPEAKGGVLRAALALSAAVQVMGLFASGTRAAMVALAAGGIVLAIGGMRTRRWAVVGTVATIIVLLPLFPRLLGGDSATGSVAVRIRLADVSVRAIADSPIIGHGPGMASKVLREQPESGLSPLARINPSAHSLVLDMALAFGLPGLAFFALVLFLWLRGEHQTDRPLGIVAAGIAGLVAVVLGFATLSVATLIAILLGASWPDRDQRASAGPWLGRAGILIAGTSAFALAWHAGRGAAGEAQAASVFASLGAESTLVSQWAARRSVQLAWYQPMPWFVLVSSHPPQSRGRLLARRQAAMAMPWDATAWEQLAREYGTQEQWGEAVEAWSHVLKLEPDHPRGRHGRGLAYRKLGIGDRAAVDLAIAARKAPNDPEVRLNFGNVLADLGRYKEADREYRHAISIRPDWELAKENLKKLQLRWFLRKEAP